MTDVGRLALLERLRTLTEDRRAVLGFVGLGYVGLPVSLAFAAAGFRVHGHDIDTRRVAALREGRLPFATEEPGLLELLEAVMPTGRYSASDVDACLSDAHVLFLAVDTPIGEDHRLRRDRFVEALDAVGRNLREGTLVIVESTIPPGTIDQVVLPRLAERSGLPADDRFFVLHCPERLRPGRLLKNLRSLGRLVGGSDELLSALGVALYRNIVFAPLQPTHYRTAEVVKTAENTARDVQVALANQLAVVSDRAGVDVRDVRAAINELWRDEPLVLEPGPGVGGHCLPKDPWLLVEGLEEDERALVSGARAMNAYMPHHVAALSARLLKAAGRELAASVVVVLGVAYEANSDDTRNSPGLAVAERLRAECAELRTHDPNVTGHDAPLEDVLRGSDLAILCAAHSEYGTLDPAAVRSSMRTPVLLDTRRALDSQTWEAAGFRYGALGVRGLRTG